MCAPDDLLHIFDEVLIVVQVYARGCVGGCRLFGFIGHEPVGREGNFSSQSEKWPAGTDFVRASVRPVKIAVVIPALDEEEQIEGAIETAQAAEDSSRNSGLEGAERVQIEVVVVDAGSRDDTVRLAEQAHARVLVSERGRARQLEVGWRAVAADVVLFLHADTRLPLGWAEAVQRSLREPSRVGGAFRLRLDASEKALRVVELFARLRVALMGLPYGDQAIFVRRAALDAMGGVPAVPIMEDLDLVRAMKARGQIEVLPLEVQSSARRYLDHGIARTVFVHLVALLAWRLGLDRGRLAAWCGR